MNRRFFVATWLALVGISRRAWAQVGPIQYAPLTRPVRIPLQQVATPWQPVPFVAEAKAPQNPALAGVERDRDAPIPETNPFSSDDDIRAGEVLFQKHCSYCHGSF